MNPIAPYDAFFSAAPILLLAIIVIGATVVVSLTLWLQYTLIWKGVRRGLEEYYGPGSYRGFTPPDLGEPSTAPPAKGDRRHRSGRLSR